MTTPFWCVLVVILIPYVLAGVGAYYKSRQFGTIDTHHPRAQAAALEGAGARANAAQLNAWEALPVFGLSVLIAHMAGADPAASAVASVGFVVVRILHAAFYIADLAPLRSVAFLVGIVCCVRLFLLAGAA